MHAIFALDTGGFDSYSEANLKYTDVITELVIDY